MRRRSKSKRSESPKMMSLNIGENDPIGNQMVSIEMDKVSKMKFKKTPQSKRNSINRIFGDVVLVDTDNERAHAKCPQMIPKPIPRKSMFTSDLPPITLDDERVDEMIENENPKTKSPFLTYARKASLSSTPQRRFLQPVDRMTPQRMKLFSSDTDSDDFYEEPSF